MRTILSIILKRLLVGCMTLFVVTIIIFGAIEMLPGDIATEVLGQAATEESLNAFREKYDLNRSLPARYLSWLGGAVTGDFGISLANQRPISELIGQRAANTFFLAGYAAAIAVPIAVVSGMLAALYNGSVFDRMLSSSTLAAISFPEFFIAYILILIFSVALGWFPSLANVDPGTGSVTLRAEFPNPDGELLPGMFVRALVEEGTRPNAILVPQQAVSRDTRGVPTVWVLAEDNTVSVRQIETERTVGNAWLVQKGLQAGEQVVTEGVQRLAPGIPVQPAPAANVDLKTEFATQAE